MSANPPLHRWDYRAIFAITFYIPLLAPVTKALTIMDIYSDWITSSNANHAIPNTIPKKKNISGMFGSGNTGYKKSLENVTNKVKKAENMQTPDIPTNISKPLEYYLDSLIWYLISNILGNVNVQYTKTMLITQWKAYENVKEDVLDEWLEQCYDDLVLLKIIRNKKSINVVAGISPEFLLNSIEYEDKMFVTQQTKQCLSRLFDRFHPDPIQSILCLYGSLAEYVIEFEAFWHKVIIRNGDNVDSELIMLNVEIDFDDNNNGIIFYDTSLIKKCYMGLKIYSGQGRNFVIKRKQRFVMRIARRSDYIFLKQNCPFTIKT